MADPLAILEARDVQSTSTTRTIAEQDPFAFDPAGSANLLATQTNSISNDFSTAQQRLRPNPLNDYESYTYALSLHAVSVAQFNQIINNPEKSYIPQNVLVASAGRYNVNFKRNSNFTEDFYFDDFRMSTVINTTVRNRNSNLIEMTFTLIEPNGFTFINRLMDALYDPAGPAAKNYLAHPYILQIDFYGYQNGELQQSPLRNMSKVIPIRLTSLKSKVTHKGTEYRIEAVPYNHQAFNQMYNTSPADFQVKAKTVQDVFGKGGVIQGTDLIQNAEDQRKETELLRQINEAEQSGAVELLISRTQEYRDIQLKNAAKGSDLFQVSGFTDALNTWYENLKERKQITQVNKYYVIFDSEIGDTNLYPDNAGPLTEAQLAGASNSVQDQKAAARQAGGYAAGKLQFNAGALNIPAGTQLTKLIDFAVRNSDFVRKQLTDSTLNPLTVTEQQLSNLRRPLKWFKIVPKLNINAYDQKNERYAVTVTYFVKAFYINSKFPYAPQGRIPGYVKRYDYIFTGQNNSIIDLQLDFDMLYYVQLVADRNKERLNETAPTVQNSQLQTENDNNPGTTSDKPPGEDSITVSSPVMPMARHYVSNDASMAKRGGGAAAAAVDGAGIQKNIMSNSRGDMINIKMKIIGDPELIKQDDIFLNQDLTTFTPGSISPTTNSLYMDGGELYVFVNFQSPVDYDESTGLAVPGYNKYSYSQFNGIYKIITIENNFTKGKFEQTMDLVRLPIDDNQRSLNINVQQRVDNYLNLALVQSQAAGTLTRFAGPAIFQRALAAATTPIYNTALGSTGGSAGGLIQGLTQQVLSQSASQLAKKGVDAVISALKPSTFSTNPDDYKSFEPTQSQYGAFGEETTAPPAANPMDFGSTPDDYYNPDAIAENADALAIDDASISEGFSEDFSAGGDWFS